MRITLSARSKILSLSNGKPFRISAIGSMLAGSHVDLIPSSEVLPNDVTICNVPLIIVSIETLTLIADRSIDYNYNTDEFVISNRGFE
jgi:hypothetical protein